VGLTGYKKEKCGIMMEFTRKKADVKHNRKKKEKCNRGENERIGT